MDEVKPESKDYHKLAFDVSFVLGSVIAGAAILVSIGCWSERSVLLNRFNFPIFCQAVSVIITILRFFHGNSVWYKLSTSDTIAQSKLSLGQRIFKAISNYYVHIGQYILFFIASQFVGSLDKLLFWFFIISIADIFWTSVAWISEHNPLLRRAEVSWFFLNIGTILAIIVLMISIPGQKAGNTASFILSKLSYAMGGIYLLSAIIDYSINSELFFGISKKKRARNTQRSTEKTGKD